MGMAAAVPAIIGMGGMIGSHFAGKSAQKSAMQMTPQESGYYSSATKAADSQTQLADTFRQQGSQLFNTGMPAVQKSLGYYSTLLGGNRAAMTQATAPETEQLTDLYGGAQRNLEHSGVRGAARDQAGAELNREKTGKIAGLIGAVRPGAAQALAGTGMQTVGAGTSALSGAAGATSSAGGLYSGLIHGQADNRRMGLDANNAAQEQVGALVASLLKNQGSKKGGGN